MKLQQALKINEDLTELTDRVDSRKFKIRKAISLLKHHEEEDVLIYIHDISLTILSDLLKTAIEKQLEYEVAQYNLLVSEFNTFLEEYNIEDHDKLSILNLEDIKNEAYQK